MEPSNQCRENVQSEHSPVKGEVPAGGHDRIAAGQTGNSRLALIVSIGTSVLTLCTLGMRIR